MESVAFEEFGIKGCLFDDCDQQFNQDSIKVAVWLYGVVFLHEEKRYECADSIFGERSEHEKIIMDKQTEGFIGITCPKCLRTNLYKKRIKEIKEFKNFLSSWNLSNKNDQGNKKLSSNWMSGLIPVDLKYYSPFSETNDVLNDFCIHSYAYDKQIDTLCFSDDFAMTFAGEEKNFENSFCSYDISDKSEPGGTHISIHWFPKEKIAEITKYENENGGRLFPRYHYFHDLMVKIDPLLKYNYFAGEQIDQMLADAKNSMKTDLRNYEFHYHKKERIEGQKRQNEIDFESPKNFFDILISDPVEFKTFLGKPVKNCDYLWIKNNPFSCKGLPLDFSFENQPDGYTEIAAELKSVHKKKVGRIRDNFTKQYVQDFLKANLVDFLEEYEGLIQSNQFSYAHLWRLKESYLGGLYNTVNKGLRNDVPFAMYSEGETWRIIFNSEAKSFKNDLGFLWIYLALLHQDTPVYYTSLNDTYENRPKNIEKDDEIIEYMKYTEELSVNYGGNLTKQFYADKRAIAEYTKKIENYLSGIESAKAYGETDQALYLHEKSNEFIDDLKKTKIECIIKDREVIVKPSKFKDSDYRDINGKIKKNYSDAMKKIKKENHALHEYFAKHIQKKDGAFIYKPSEDIDWHLF